MYLAPSGSYPPLDMAMDRYEPATTRLFQETVKPDMVVIDIGAHVGYFSLLAAKLVGHTGKVYSFEPEPGNHAVLLKNIDANGYDNIVATQMAVSDRTGNLTLYITALDSGRHSVYHHGLPERGSVTVESTSLDSFLESEGWPTVDLIKVDVEGAEVAVLDGMTQLMEKNPDLRLIIEFNPALLQDGGVTPIEFLERLHSIGWYVTVIDEIDGLSPLTETIGAALVDRLLAADSSVNLYCTRR
jgi:FkbM family methyltransferase